MRPFSPSLCLGIQASLAASALSWASSLAWGQAHQAAQAFRVVSDPQDAIRRSYVNLGPNAVPPEEGTLPLPDLLSYKIGIWQPLQPAMDLFRGGWTQAGAFFRLDLTFGGLVNPPGTVGCCGNPFDPFMHGPRPVFGCVEIDMDSDPNTGGELDIPNLYYLGNVARFGGRPELPRFHNRVAADDRAFDGNINTAPFVDRSGEEFHVAFHGWEILSIVRNDETDVHFGSGDTWVLSGTLFHRAGGYERFSTACCTGAPGSYNPVVQIQFVHFVDVDRTVVSLVYPLTNAASAAQDPGPTEIMDNVVDNQNSIHEALNELVFSAQTANAVDRNDPDFVIISGWATKQAADYLNPVAWDVTVLIGGSVREASNGDIVIAWSDVHPNVQPGDFNGDGQVAGADLLQFDAFMETHDGLTGFDADQTVNGEVWLIGFVPNFSVFDMNYDGVITTGDRPTLLDSADYDADGDGDVDLFDFALLQRCRASAPGPAAPACTTFDWDGDGTVGLDDAVGFGWAMTGPG